MAKRVRFVTAVLIALLPLAGCASSRINSYLLPDAVVGGDPGKAIKPIKGVLVWPLENIASGSKSKGVETRFTGLLADTLQLRGEFETVVVFEDDQAKDLLARAGEELGLKKKPKAPMDGALIATKLGQLTGTEVVLVGRIEDYDEDKVDKATLTVVSASFNLIDAREKAYTTLDSFAPAKRVWRTSIKYTSQEGPFTNRESIDDAARTMMRRMVDRMTADLQEGTEESEKALAKEKEKAEAQERAKRAAVAKAVDEIKGKAEAAAKTGNLEGAIAEYKKIFELDKGNKEATKSIEALEKQIADRKKAEDKKPEAEAPKPAEPSKAAEPAKPVARPTETPKAVEAPKPAETPKAAAPKAAEPAAKGAGEAKPAAAGAGDLETLRNQAMAAFNKEDYPASRDLWKKILAKVPDDKQAKEMLETTEMLLNALK